MLFLDTNICIHYLKGEHPSIRENLLATHSTKEFIRVPGVEICKVVI